MDKENNFNKGLDLSDILDITSVPGIATLEEDSVLPPMELPLVQSNPNDVEQDLDDDYQIIRQTQINQLAMLTEVSKQMVEIVRNSDTPKTVEIFANLMDTVTRTNSAILDNYSKMKKLKNQESKPKTTEAEFSEVKTMSPQELLQHEGTRDDYLVQESFKEENK